MKFQYRTVLLLVIGSGLLSACGSTNPPNQQLAETQMVIQQAEQVGAEDYAPLEIREARKKLEAARASVEDEEFEEAERLIEQARVDAELAHIKTLSGKSEKAVTELRESIRTLEEEINKNRNEDF